LDSRRWELLQVFLLLLVLIMTTTSARNLTMAAAVVASMAAIMAVHSGLFHLRHGKIQNMLLPVLQGKVLDCGCYDGESSARLLKSSWKIESVRGIDPYLPKKVAILAKWYDGVNIPFQDKEFDVVLASFILHHVDDDGKGNNNNNNAGALIGEMKRVGKLVVVVEDSVDGWAARWTTIFMHEIIRLVYGMGYSADGFRTKTEWKAAFEQQGLQVVAQRDYSSTAIFFPFLRHSLYVLLDKNDDVVPPIQVELYDPMFDATDVINSGIVLGALYGLRALLGGKTSAIKKIQ